jgi:hypothetical protein
MVPLTGARFLENAMKQRRFVSYRPQLEILEDRLTMSGPGANNPHILPPQSSPFGASYAEWSARWWQWAYSLPIDHHPLFDTADVSAGQSGKVWFLGASFVSTTNPSGVNVSIVTRNVTVPTGKAFFVPVANVEASTVEGNGTTDAELRAAAISFQDTFTNMSAQFDGAQVQNLGAYRVQSPLFTFGPLPDNNVLQFFGLTAPAGTTSLSVGDGVYLMLAPLSAGQHSIHFHAESPAFNFLLDVTYNLTVVGGKSGSQTLDSNSSASPSLAGMNPLVAFVPPAGPQQALSLATIISSPTVVGLPTTIVTAPESPAAGKLGVNFVIVQPARPQLSDTAALDHFFAIFETDSLAAW